MDRLYTPIQYIIFKFQLDVIILELDVYESKTV